MGKILLVTGLLIAIMGFLLMIGQRSGGNGWFGWFGNLPLDFRVEKENFRLYFPLGSSILISIIISLVLSLINKFIR
jgi:hypothetical protein